MSTMDFNMFMQDVVEVGRKDMVEAGYTELTTPEEVDEALQKEGTTLVFVNSICGCAGGIARPASANALHYNMCPEQLLTVFTGQDHYVKELARSNIHYYMSSYPTFSF